MFTGIIQGLGLIRQITPVGGEFKLTVEAEFDWGQPLEIGESIAVSGACLTVSQADKRAFTAHVSAETRSRSTINDFKPGHRVNLERALRLSDRLGGHLVTGHVDGVGRIQAIEKRDESHIFTIGLSRELVPFLVEKGSVAVDGISLTVNKVSADAFTVNIIPSTLVITTLRAKRPGDRVNIETDLIGKYVARFMAGFPVESKVDREFLAEHGFL